MFMWFPFPETLARTPTLAQNAGIMRGLLRALVPIVAWQLVACGPPPQPVVKKKEIPVTDPEIDADKGIDVKKARALLDRAEEALKNKDVASVKRLVDQADRFANDQIREEMRQLLQRADQLVAKDLAPPVLELARAGECQKAAERVVEIADKHKGTTVIRFVKDEISKPTLECLLKALSIDVSVARELAESAAIKKALNPDDFEQWDAKLDEATVGTLVASLQEPIAKRAWAKVVKDLDEMVARKEAGAHEVSRVMKVVRHGIGEDIEKKASAGIGNKTGASGMLKDIDALLAAGRWDATKDPVPDNLARRRKEAAFWAVCAAQDCNTSSSQMVWAYGLLDVRPLLDLSGQPVARIKHARQVWRIAEGKSWSLIADQNPGVLEGIEARIPAALGWVPAGGLATSDTSERLPPGEAIVGTRVWGELREKHKEWELGFVREANGDQLNIERVADGKFVKKKRGEIRFGTLQSGTKVLALCAHPIKMESAVVDEVVPISANDAHVKLTCLDEKGTKTSLKREVLMGSLRTQAGWIPAK
jgi:hypothetical protein